MARPKQQRAVHHTAGHTFFKPCGTLVSRLETVTLNVEELEAIRLKDNLRYDQSRAATLMNVSQPTFHRVLAQARKKVADALVQGKAIRISSGNYVRHHRCTCEKR